ncbi:MAG: carbon-nitrogen hydrolase family protein [Candidatus Dormibacteraeota bacterium]|nr:carbon-nitrogen hydrolase family protein [Candidatus Dormibacteraeota bacterium]
MKPFLLAVAQLGAVRADKDANLQHMAAAMHEAASAGAQAIVFPELSLTGYVLGDDVYALAEPRTGPSLQRLSALARESGLLTVYGWPESSEDGPIYDSAALIERDGSLLDVYRKTHLFGREAELFAAGERLSAIDTSLGRIGVAICYDLEFPETARLLALDGARILVTLTASTDPYAPYQAVYTRARAMENSIYVATANTVGELDGRHFFGESSIVDPTGGVIAMAGRQDKVLIGEVDLTAPHPAAEALRYLQNRRPELYGGLTH